MKIIILGAKGFIGRNVSEELEKEYEIIKVERENHDGVIGLDLLDSTEVENLITKELPSVIINCAGTVENSESAFAINPVITFNVLQVIEKNNLKIRYLVCGSAGEYGIVEKLPVKEEFPLLGSINYAKSKIIEESVASYFINKGLPVTILRIFNPIGSGMQPRFLIPSLIKQINEIKGGKEGVIEISRLDAQRDYIDVKDISRAISFIVKNKKDSIYNIGSGKSISNKNLVELIVSEIGVTMPILKETSEKKEPQYATQADIKRIINDTGWEPTISLKETVRKIVEESKND